MKVKILVASIERATTMKIKGGYAFCAFVATVLGAAAVNLGLSGSFWLMSQPNDAASMLGLLCTLTVAGGAVLGARGVWWLVKRATTAAVLAIALTGCAGCERIDAGHVGIKIQLAGSNRGVQSIPIVTGYAFYNPVTEDVLEYPVFVQTALWSRPRDGETEPGANEELSFNDKDGVRLAADMSLSYQLDSAKVPAFYVKFRTDDLAAFTHGYLRNVARDHLNEVAGTYSVEALYGPKKEEVVKAVRARINAELKPIGITIEQLGFIGAPRPPDNVIAAINAKIASTQAAMQTENELRAAEAEARKTVATANGAAQAAIAKAEGDAKAKIAMAEGEAKANQAVAASITPQLLEWRHLNITEQAVGKWDGRRPTVEGSGAGMLLQIDTAK